ncbi:MAG: MarR family transcriptional regulator [Leptolyngbyaceae cyanobacterium SM1_3_5]|nr:MarR family transcriptional regulator [Leptolyngbyaceae cyanobacterium SM1_3_5]
MSTPRKPSDRPLRYQTVLNMEQTMLALNAAFETALSEFGLGLAQWDTLRQLRDHPGASGAEIARLVKVTPQAVATMLQRLEKAQLITRREAATGRVVKTYLTPQSELLLQKGEQIAEQIEARAFSAFSAEEKEQFNHHLHQCIASLNETKPPH